MTIKNNNIGDKNRKISGKKIMLVTALLSGGVVIRVNHHINNSFGNVSKEVISFDLTLESTDVLIDDKGTFYVGQGTPIDNFDIADFVTILDESGKVIPKSEVTLEWDVKEYFEGTTFGTKGEYLITISASMDDGRSGELEYKLVVKEGHIFEEIKAIEDIEIEQDHTADLIDFQEHFRVLNSATGEETLTNIDSTLEDEDLRTLGTKQVIFYTELNGTRFTNSVHISVVDTVAPVIELESSFDNESGFEWDEKTRTITISELDKTIGDFTLDEYATAYDGSGEFELSWDFNEVMENNLNKIGAETVTITAIDSSGNERVIEIYVNISTVKFEFKDGISEVAFELFHDANINDSMYTVSEFYNVFDAAGNPVAVDRISWDLTEEMIRELGEYKITIEVLDDNDELIGAKGETVIVQDTLAPEAILNQGVNTNFNIEVNQSMTVDNLFMYLDGVSDIDQLITVTENSGVWGYRFLYNGRELTDTMLRTVGSKAVILELFDYDIDGEENNHSYLYSANGSTPMSFTLNIVDTKDPSVNVINEIIDLEVVQNATKEMIQITNYAEINDNSGVFTWELRVKGSQDAVMDYQDILGKVTSPQGVELELVVSDANGNVTYNDMLLIVSDTTPPVIEVRLSEETININPSAGDLTTIRDIDNYVRVTDNSRNPEVTWDFDQVIGQATVAGVYYVTVTAKDDSGNVSEETITFTVVDNEAPVIIVNTKTIEIEANEYTNKDELEFDINLKDYITVTDNSNGLIDTMFDYSSVDFGAIGTYEVIITATDAAGNESINIIELKVIAGEPKVRVVNDKEIIDNVHIDSSNTISGIKIVTQGGKILIERTTDTNDQADILTHLTMENLLEFLTINGETIESQTWDLSTIDFSTIGTYDIQLTVTNNFGKTATETIEFVVIQEYDSILELKGDNFIDLEIDASDTNRDVSWFESTYDENDYAKFIASGGSGTFVWDQTTLTNIDFDRVGSYVVTIYLDDGHADRKELTLSLNIIDTTGPVFTTVNDMETAEVNDKDSNDYVFADFVTVEDNSGIAPTLSWNLDTQVDFTKVGTYVVTIKAVDAYGNETTKDITFEINDTEAPVLVINPGMDIQTIEINSRDASSFNINSFVTATDNSGIAPELEWNIQDLQFDTTGTYTITIKATDNAGNESNEVTIAFEVEDTIAPSIDIDPVGLEELKVEIDTKSESDYTDWLEDYVTVTDNSNEDITPTWDITSVDFGTVGSYMIVISAVDSSNQTSTVNVVFAVADTTAPTISLVSGQETTEYEVFDSKLEDFKIADFATCDDSTDCTMSWDMSSVNFDRVGTYVVTIKAVDMYGNESVQEITIEVIDTVAPVIEITRPDILLSMNKFTSSDFDVDNFAKVTDNYDKSVTLTWSIQDVDFDTVGEYTVIISAIDSSGNEAEEKEVTFKVEEFNITVNEVIPFVIEVDQGNLESNFDVNTYFTAEDQNGVAVNSIVWNLTDDMLKTYGTYGVMLTITFDTDKVIEMEVTLEVVDNTAPNVAVDTTTTTIELGDSSTFDNLNPEYFVTVTDNSNDVTYSWDFDNVVEQTVAGTYIVAITVTDIAGNETAVTTEIVVVDTVDPVLELNDDFDRNNMVWSKSTAELNLLASDKTLADIDLWELVTATDLSTAGLTISWSLTETDLDTVGHYTLDIEVSDGTNVSTETITVNVLRATPILNDFNVDKSYDDVTVNVDVTNLNEAITSLVITLQEIDGTVVDTYTQTLSALDAYTINHVFNTGVISNTEYKVVLEYKYSLQEDKTTQVETVTDTKDVKTLTYVQNDVLGTITDVYLKHEEITVNYEVSNEFSLLTNAKIVLTDSLNTPVEHLITDMSTSSGTYTFTGLKSNTEYKIEIILDYNFNDGNNVQTKTSDMRDVETLEYTEHDVIVDITGITQSPSTISVDYNISDVYNLITGNMIAKLYKADNMTTIEDTQTLTGLNDTVQFIGLDANTSYIIIIEVSLDLVQDGTNTVSMVKETGLQTTTEAYSFDEITVNINNVIVDYNEITFDYEVFDPNGLLVGTTDADKVKLNIGGQEFDLNSLNGTVKLSDHLNDVTSGTSYDVQIHFDYNLKDNNGNITHDTNLYGFVESTRAYDVNTDLTLTSHNLASDMQTIYVDYSLRNLNLIGDMSTLSVTIRNKDTGDYETIAFSALTGISLGQLEGSFELDSINGNDLIKETDYEITISIDYDLNDGNGIKTNLLLLENAQIQTKDVPLVGYNVISTIERGYTFLNVDFHIEDDLSHGTNLLNSFKIALLDENGIPVTNYDYITYPVSSGDNNIKFENLLSDATYTVVYRIDNPYYGSASGEGEFIDITRKVTTRTYDTNLIDVDYTLTQGLTYLHLENISILNTNEVFENIEYNSVIAVITYTTRDGQVITVEKDLGSLTEGDFTSVVFADIQSNTDINIEFRLEHDLKDGEGIQSGTDEIIRTSDSKTLEYDFTFTIENDEVLVTGLTPGFTGDHLVIFEEVEGYTVKDIKADAFYGDSISFSQLTIPRTLEIIGQNAFRNVSLTKVNLTSIFEIIPTVAPRTSSYSTQGMLVIEDNAFRDNAIVGFDFSTTETIGISAFRTNSLGDITIGDSVSYVGQEAFVNAGVTKLTTGSLLSDTNFGSDSFVGNQISDLTVGNIGFKHNSLGISNNVFASSGFKLTFADSVVGAIEGQAWRYNTNDSSMSNVQVIDLVIGSGVTEIGVSSFYGNALNDVVIGEGVHTISRHAFDTTGMNTLTLGSSVELIDQRAFSDNNLTQVIFPETLEIINNEAFKGNDIETLVIPNSVNYIALGAFKDNNMKNLTLGSLLSDENFGTDTFTGNAIENLTVGNIGFVHNSLGYSKDVFNNNGFNFTLADTAVGEIKDQAWRFDPTDAEYSDVPIIDLTIGNGVTKLGISAFLGNQLNGVVIGDGVVTIERHAFDSTGIKTLTLGSSVETIGLRAFQNNFLEDLILLENVKEIGSQAFRNNLIEDLTIPDSVEYIDFEAFSTNRIHTLTLGELLSDENFGGNAFVSNSISDLTVGNIGFVHDSLGYSKDVFNNQGFSLTLADTAVGNIADQAWRYDTSDSAYSDVPIIDVTIGSGIEVIGVSAFYGNSLNDVVIGESVHTISRHAFNSTGIRSVEFLGDKLKEIQDSAFINNNLTKVELPSSLEELGPLVFQNNNITELKIPSSMTSVGVRAFANNGLTDLEIEKGVMPDAFLDYAFANVAFNANGSVNGYLQGTIENLTISDTNFVYDTLGNANNAYSTTLNLTYADDAVGDIPTNAWRSGTSYSKINIGDLTIGTQVTGIGNNAFQDNNIGDLIINTGVVKIGDNSFKNSNITSLEIKGSLETIGNNAFEGNSIAAVTLPDTLTSIGDYAFEDNALTSVVIPNSVTNIGSYAFANNLIETFNFVNNITNISEGMLDNNKLKSLVLPEHIQVVGVNAFRNNEIAALTLSSNIDVFSNGVFENNKLTSFVIENNITSIGDTAFKGNQITELTVPSNVNHIGSEAFADNTVLSKLTLEDGVETSVFTSGNAFTGNNISELIVGSTGFKHDTLGNSGSVFNTTAGLSLTYTDNASGAIGNSVWEYSTASTTSNVQLNSLVLSDNISSIGTSSFKGNNFQTLDMGTSITSVGNNSFEESGISSLTLNKSLQTIGNDAFKNNDITLLDITENITTIGSGSFANNGLSKVTIPDNVTSVGDEAFSSNVFGGARSLTELIIEDGVTASVFGNNTFVGNAIQVLVVGSTDFKHNTFGNSSNVFNTTTGLSLTFTNNATGEIVDNAWEYSTASTTSSVQLNAINIGDSITSVGYRAFYGNKLQKVTIGNGVRTLGEQSFASMGITELILGTSIETIGKEAFVDNQIPSFTFYEALTTIGEGAFKNNAITTLSLPDSVNRVGSNAFENNNMTTLSIGALLSDGNFDNNTFYNNNINDLTVGNVGFKHNSLGYSKDVFNNSGFKLTYADSAVGNIADQSWRYDTSDSAYSDVPIIDVSIGSGIEIIGVSAFLGNSLNDVVIGGSVHTISRHAFNSTGISTVEFLGSNLREIQDSAFINNNLTVVDLPSSIQTIGPLVFQNNKISKLKIPENMVSVGTRSFANNSLTELEIAKGVPETAFLDYAFAQALFNSNGSLNSYLQGTINKLILNDVNYVYDSLGQADKAFNPTLNITYTEDAVGAIPAAAWRSGTSYSNINIGNLEMGSQITSIGSAAFLDNNMGDLTISSGITDIADNAFKNSNITSVDFQGSVVSIGSNAFEGNSISTMNLPSSLTSIGTYAFEDNDLTSVNIPDGVTSMGNYAFANNDIATFNFVDGMSTISDGLLDNNNLTTLDLPKHIHTIGAYAFRNNDIATLDLGDTITEITHGVFEGNELTVLTLEDNITSIGITAFKGNNLTEVEIPNTVTYVGLEAFSNNSITKLTIGEGITSSAFSQNNSFTGNSIKELVLGDGSFKHNTFGASSSVFNTSTGLTLSFTDLAGGEIPTSAWEYGVSSVRISSLDLGDGVTAIGNRAFVGNTMTSLVVGSSIETIGSQAFQSVTMSSVDFGAQSSVKEIKNDAFGSNRITSLVLPDSVVTLGNNAFAYNSIANLTTGAGLSTSGLGSNTFLSNNVSNLTLGNPTIKHNSLGSSSSVFNTTSGLTLAYSDKAVGAIPDQAWRYDTSNSRVIVKDLTIGDGVTNIGFSSFWHNQVSNVVIGAGVVTIQRHAFNTAGVRTVQFVEGNLNNIEDSAFISNYITTLKLPNSLKDAEVLCFADNNISSLTFGDELETIGVWAFRNSKNTQVRIPATVTWIGREAFSGNSNLSAVYFLRNTTTGITIESNVFGSAKYYDSVGNVIT